MRQKNVFLLLWVTLTCVACSSTLPSFKSYKLDIQQGNVVTSKMMDQVRPGMSKSQVKYVLGTPLIQDTFHKDRWDYLYQYRHENKITQQNRVILYFKNDVLDKIAGDPIPEGTLDPASLPKSDVMLEQADKRTFVEKLKFWNAREAQPNSALAAKGASEKADEGSLLDKLKFWKSNEAEVADKSALSKAEDAAKDTQLQAKAMAELAQASPPEMSTTQQVAEAAAEKVEPTKKEEDATTSLLAVPIEATVVASAPAIAESASETVEVAKPAVETVADVVAPVVEATAVASAPLQPEPQMPAPVAEATPEVVASKEEPVLAPEPSPEATMAENKPDVAKTDDVYQSYNTELESPTLLLDKKLKILSDKPIAKINATPDIPPQLRLSRTLADAPSMDVPVSEVSLKPSPAAKVPPSPDTSEPGIFERMLEKIGF